jgi:hypothetical protein
VSDHFNELSPGEAERLAMLIEECGEVIQAATKILRHGYASYDPTDESKGNNQTMLGKELGDLDAIIGIMLAAQDFPSNLIATGAQAKMVNLRVYAHHQPAKLLDRGRG